MSQSRDRRRNRRRYSRQPLVNQSTQTERQRPADQTPTINGSVILKITDYTKLDDNEQSSIDETSLSGTSSRASAQSKARRQENAAINFKSGSSQTNKNWRIVGTYDLSSDSDSDASVNLNKISYDYLEGEPLVTSLTDLRLSDSEDDQQQLYLTEMTSNEEKLAKL
uniref:Solute carrier family 41 member 2 n=1 Tax=Zeugodacus cucurbitae TaxID=28588 RepID=A0A0A1WQH1_ZEUCU